MSQIGNHLRTLRERKKLSLASLAEESGFSKGFLSKIENGRAQPPIATLMKLATALGSDLGSIFDGPRPDHAPASVLTRTADRQKIARSKDRPYGFERLSIGSPFRMTPYIIELDEDHDAPPTYQHAGEEMIFVLAGELKYAAGGRLHHLRKGDTLIFDATIQHGPIKLPGKKASYLAVFAGEPGFQSTSPNRRGRKKVS